MRRLKSLVLLSCLLLVVFAVGPGIAEEVDLDPTLASVRSLIDRYFEDAGSLRRANRIPMNDQRELRALIRQWQTRLQRIDFGQLDVDGQVDYLLMDKELKHQLEEIDFERARDEELQELLPFAGTMQQMFEDRQSMKPLDARGAAERLNDLAKAVRKTRQETDLMSVSKPLKRRVGRRLSSLVRALKNWHAYYSGYDPNYTWWAKRPYEDAVQVLEAYENEFRIGRDEIVGDPIGDEALRRELAYEMIAYSPAELIKIAEREFVWCEREMLRAAKDLGFEDRWLDALEHVKGLHVEPGEQPELIRIQAHEAVRFLDAHGLVTIPANCRSTWRIEMMSPERQRVNPYFTGGEVISVSFPTDTMSHPEKLMSLRSNNEHFCRATVHHELIPGHHLQLYMADRYRAHRKPFRTPFLIEGWALYWEMLLWDMEFQRSAEDRIGMLFWRMHRCARIVLSLGFHVGKYQPEEMVDFLVTRVGHERSAAEAEVRRWVAGGYGPLYQAAYMLGGLQIMSMRRELVDTGKLTDREFHDAILRENSIPIALIRAKLGQHKLSRDFRSDWRF